MRTQTPIDIAQAETLASRGLTLEQIAAALGISTDTLGRRRKTDKALEHAILSGQAKGIAKVANALYEQAMGGNTTAAIFYLKARAGWTDKLDLTHAGPDGGPLQTVSMTTTEFREIAKQVADEV